jgi:hypothetical protein
MSLVGGGSKNHDSAMTHDPKSGYQKTNKPPRKNWYATDRFYGLRLSDWFTIALTAALVAVGVLQLCIYFRQADIMDKQAHISATANKQNAAVNIAFVNPKEINFLGPSTGITSGNEWVAFILMGKQWQHTNKRLTNFYHLYR